MTQQEQALTRIKSQPEGARFYRADLHIHSFDGSYDVKDSSMTVEQIISKAAESQIDVVAITDHDSIKNVRAAVDASIGTNVLVIPGVELSTPQGHLLVYFRDCLALEGFYGKLTIRDQGTDHARCEEGMTGILGRIKSGSGFAILAHADAEKGLDIVVPGYSPHKKDILLDPNLLGVELKQSNDPRDYSSSDQDLGRRNIICERINALSLATEQGLGRVRFSDAHILGRIGHNAQQQPRITRVKMDTPSFDGLRLALLDSDARVRLEDEVPRDIPHIVGVSFGGGFLDDQVFRFSKNLNCIIGGRGAGKSTAFEAIRCITSSPSQSKIVDSEIWPDQLTLIWADEAGQEQEIIRRVNETPINASDPDWGPTVFPIECYGQGETAATSQRAQTDPSALLEYLDQFIDVTPDRTREDEFREQLLKNQTEIEEARNQVAQIPQYQKALFLAKEQLSAIAKAKGDTVVTKQQKVAEERAIREAIGKLLVQISKSISFDLLEGDIKLLDTAADPAKLLVGGSYFDAVRTATKEFASVTTNARTDIRKAFTELSSQVKANLQAWAKAEEPVLQEIELIRKELEAKGVKLDLAFIKKLAEDKSKHEKTLSNLDAWKKRLATLEQDRKNLIAERWKVRDRMYAVRTGFAKKASEVLEGSLGDLQVSVKFRLDGHCSDGADIIQRAMNWRTVQVHRARILAEILGVRKLLDAIDKKDVKAIVALKTHEDQQAFSTSDANDIIQRLAEPSFRFTLERCVVQDRPVITVTKRIGDKRVSRDFPKLSLGQQQSVLLALMLTSDSPYPLIIDQPEDNLDSEFIYHSLVPVLRRAKERRQIIIVTHNANIAVLGDAESIFVLKSMSDRGSIVRRGSIDNPEIRNLSCQILEGADAAFKRRGRIYGYLQ